MVRAGDRAASGGCKGVERLRDGEPLARCLRGVPYQEIILTPAQLAELAEFASKFPKLRVGVVDMGRGYVLVRVYDAHDVPVGQALLDAPPEL